MAKKFQFRLERVQKLRERVRDARQLAHAEALQYQFRVEGQIGQLQSIRNAETQVRREIAGSGELSVDSLIRSRLFDTRLAGLRRVLDQQLTQVKQVVAARKAALVEAERNVKILEKLEGRLHTRYDDFMNAEELKFMDELALQAEARRRLGLELE